MYLELNFKVLPQMKPADYLLAMIRVIFHIYIENAYLKTNNPPFLMPVALLIATDLLFTAASQFNILILHTPHFQT